MTSPANLNEWVAAALDHLDEDIQEVSVTCPSRSTDHRGDCRVKIGNYWFEFIGKRSIRAIYENTGSSANSDQPEVRPTHVRFQTRDMYDATHWKDIDAQSVFTGSKLTLNDPFSRLNI